MKRKLTWGLLATGRIARAFAAALPRSSSGRAGAVASRTLEKAQAFAREFSIPRAYGCYEELLDDPGIEAVYISTPHPQHAEWAIRAAAAGKHVLCEKPLAVNAPQAEAVIESALRHDVFLMEAFMYRCSPLTLKMCELLQQHAVGEVRLIRASFGFRGSPDLEGRHLNNALGGGGILDVGCYTVSMARLVAGIALGGRIAEPVDVKASGHVGASSRCDEWAVASLRFEKDILAQCATAVQLNLDNECTIFGSEGTLRLPSPWFGCGADGGAAQIHLQRHGSSPRVVEVRGGPLYALEADAVAEHIDARRAPWPCMTPDDTLGNMRALDRWRAEVGVEYPADTAPGMSRPVSGRPLSIRPESAMTYGRLAGLDHDLSRLVLGTMRFGHPAQTFVLCDAFFERGGNVFDTAFAYGRQASVLFGQWVRARGVRDRVFVVAKGAHPPHCTPDDLHRELSENLEWLGMDSVDIYLLHRDDPHIPVAEWIEALNAETERGRMRVFGASNWTTDRVAAANACAAKAGKQGIALLSNHFSLARMIEPPWPGCRSSATPEGREWHTRNRFPNFAWSSQAQGFLAPGRAAPDKRDEPHLVRCWYSDDNFERRQRLYALAARKQASPMALALRYVLDQPFPQWALIGPDNLAELRASAEALACALTPGERQWLNLEAPAPG